MSYITTGLPNGGRTAHYQISYDDSLYAPLALPIILGFVEACEQDFALMKGWFGGIELRDKYPLIVQVATGSGGATTRNISNGQILLGESIVITLNPWSDSPDSVTTSNLLRYLIVCEVTELFMLAQNKGWFAGQGFFHAGDEGSKGEGLSRFLGVQFQLANGLGEDLPTDYEVTYIWMNSIRANYIDNAPDDHQPDVVTGCTTCFIYYLHNQLGYGITDIINAASGTLAGVYQNLTGKSDGWVAFSNLVNSHYPTGHQYLPPSDNLFPVSKVTTIWAPNLITCGYSGSAELFIDLPAKAEIFIALSSDNPEVATVDAQVSILPGATSVGIPVSAPAIQGPFAPINVQIRVTYAGQDLAFPVYVVPPRLATMSLSPDTVVSGQSSTGTITLENPSLLGEVDVSVFSGSPGFVSVPMMVTIPQNSPSGTFPVNTPATSIPFVPTNAEIVASYSDSFCSATLTINPQVNVGIIRSLTLSPASVIGGNHSIGTVTLESKVPTPTVVGLAAHEAGLGPLGGGGSLVASVPSSITIPANQLSESFLITTHRVLPPTLSRLATILASAVVTKYAALTVTQ